MKHKILLAVVILLTFCIECVAQCVTGQQDGNDYVDLGLPGGTLWATYNVGARKPTEYGNYYAWGEVKPYKDSIYYWPSYKFIRQHSKSLKKASDLWKECSKYICHDQYTIEDSVIWYDRNGMFIGDNLKKLQPEDDAATVNWGNGWRMPTIDEMVELIKGCNWKGTQDYNGEGVAGLLGTSKINGNTIFLPVPGYRVKGHLSYEGTMGSYWSSSLCTDLCDFAECLDINCAGYIVRYTHERYFGYSVRAVVNK
ncbi:MAG TPA: hypothetical protein O0X14_03415 [Methanocorpusculum sp.]|nr:hypothetical protein [Methanocorpusculum sp.]